MNLMNLLANWPEHLSFSNGYAFVACRVSTGHHPPFAQWLNLCLPPSFFRPLSEQHAGQLNYRRFAATIHDGHSRPVGLASTPLSGNLVEVISKFETLHLLLRGDAISKRHLFSC